MPTKKLFLALACWSSLSGYVSVTKTGMSYDHTAQGTSGELFVAATNPVAGKETLSVALAVPDATDGRQEVTLQGLVPSSTQINGRTQVGGSGDDTYYIKKNEANPLYNSKIHWFSTYNNMPLAVCGANADSAQTLVTITNLVDGSSVRTNESAVRDADGAIGGTIKAAVGGARVIPSTGPFDAGSHHNLVFAAVTPNGGTTFAGQDAAGIAVLYNYGKGLVQLDATGNRSATPRAVTLPHSLIQANSVGAITGITSMHWDSTLQRLFIGLSLDDGGIAVVVGYIKRLAFTNEEVQGTDEKEPNIGRADCELVLSPIYTGEDLDTEDYLFGSSDGGRTIRHLNTMHTSLGRSYVVIDRGSGLIHALPIINGTGRHRDHPDIGLIAQKSDVTQRATLRSHLHLNNLPGLAATCPGLQVPETDANDMIVKGDAVYVSLPGEGIYSATVAVDGDGMPQVWQYWQAVSQVGALPYGFSVDALGRAQFVSGVDAESRDTVNVTMWGQGAHNTLWGGTTDDASAGIVSRVNTLFPPTEGGVHAVAFQSDDSLVLPPWPERTTRLNSAALMYCLGRNRCVVVMTYEDGNIVTAANFTADDHFAHYDLSTDGLDLGMLTTAHLSRSTTDGDEWLFVGGQNGLAVRSKTNGTGVGAAISQISDIGAGFRFKELTKADGSSFSYVRSIHTHGDNLFVLDSVGLYRISMSEDKFKDVNDALAEVLIATPTTLLGSSEHQFLSFLGMGNYGFLATTAGLWTQKDENLSAVDDINGDGGWQELYITPGDTDSFGVCSDLIALPYFVTGLAQGIGTVQVLSADTSLNVATVYRLAVISDDPGGSNTKTLNHSISSTPRYYTSMLGQLRGSAYTEGGFLYDLSSPHHVLPRTQNGMIRILPLATGLSSIDAWSQSLSPSLETTNGVHTIGKMARDHITGTLVVPTNMGIRILQ